MPSNSLSDVPPTAHLYCVGRAVNPPESGARLIHMHVHRETPALAQPPEIQDHPLTYHNLVLKSTLNEKK